jgi:hypothetical protein
LTGSEEIENGFRSCPANQHGIHAGQDDPFDFFAAWREFRKPSGGKIASGRDNPEPLIEKNSNHE